MVKQLVVPSKQDQKFLSDSVYRVRRMPYENFYPPESDTIGAPEIIMVRLPDGGIPASQFICGEDGYCNYQVGKAECDVMHLQKTVPYEKDSDVQMHPNLYADILNATQPIAFDENGEMRRFQEWVYNPYLYRAYGQVAPFESDQNFQDGLLKGLYTTARRERSGLFVVSRPTDTFKAKTLEDVLPGDHGLVQIYLGGVNSLEVEDVWLNWMHGGEKVSADKEVLIKFFEDERKWVIIGAECEISV